MIGTLVWLWAALMFLPHTSGGDPESHGFALMGAALALGYFLVCPVFFALSIWLRPTREAYRFVYVASAIGLYALILASLIPLGSALEDRTLKITVMDAQSNPMTGVKIHYQTLDHHFNFAFSLPSLQGDIYTDANGQVFIKVPQSHQVQCDLTKEGFAHSVFRMDRVWGYGIHQSSFEWIAPDTSTAGVVQFDVPDAKVMEAKLYVPHQGVAEKLPYPSYNPSWLPKTK